MADNMSDVTWTSMSPLTDVNDSDNVSLMTTVLTLADNMTQDNSTDSDNDAMMQKCILYAFFMNTVCVGSVCIAGLIGNIITFIVFWKDTMKTSTSFLFQGLSVIDSLLLILVFPMFPLYYFTNYTGIWLGYGTVYEYVLVYILPWVFLAQAATIWVTVLVTINRYIAVCKPYQAPRLCTVLQARRQLAVVLIFSALYTVPKFADSRVMYIEQNDTDSQVSMLVPRATPTALGDNRWYHIIYSNICYTVFLMFLPLLILTILNIRLINALKALQQKRQEMQSMRQQQDNNVTFVLIIVVMVFTVCQVPALVNQILWNVLPDQSRQCGGFQFYFRNVSNMLVIANSAVNFVIYFLFNTRFKQILMETLCGKDYHLHKGYKKQRNTVVNNHTKTEVDGTTDTLL